MIYIIKPALSDKGFSEPMNSEIILSAVKD